MSTVKAPSKSRTTKAEKHAFIKWYLSEDRHEEIKDYSGGKLSYEYQKETNIIISPTFINRNRNLYVIHNGDVLPKYVYESIINGNFK